MAAIYDALGNYVGEDTTGSNGGTTTVVANPPNPPTTNTVPNTTTNTKKVVYQTAAKDTGVKPASDPSQFPAYDDNGNLQPGFKINDETGQTYYAGVAPPTKDPYGLLAAEDEAIAQSDAAAYASASVGPRDPYGLLAAEDAALAEQAAARGDAEAYDRLSTKPGNLNDPYAGLSPTQLKDLGGADPTDPYIRARLGIPQLPGSTLVATSGFGFGNLNTGLPSIDNALGTIKGLFGGLLGGGAGGGSGLSSLFTNFSATVGGLFGGKPTAATTGTGVAALVAPANTFTAKDTAGILAAEDAQLAAEAAAQGDADAFGKLSVPRDPNGVLAAEDAQLAADAAAQGDADAFGKLATSPVSNTTLNADQADAFYNGTGTPTAAQALAQDKQLAADAAKLYPGTQNKALLNIDKGYAAIEENTAGIANAEKIVAANNAELADPNISDARRAELLANNEAQQEYIQVATENTAIQQNVIEQNANVYAAGGGNEGDGLKTTPVDPTTLEGFGVQAPVDPTTLEGFGVQAPVDPTTLEGYGIQATVDPTTIEGFGLPVDPAEDPFETARLEAEAAAAAEGPTETNLDVDPLTDDELAVQEAFQQDQRNALAETYGPDAVADPELIAAEEAALFDQQRVGPADPYGVLAAEDEALAQEAAAQSDAEAFDSLSTAPADVSANEDAALFDELATREDRNAAINTDQASALVDQEQGSQQASIVAQAKKQATVQARYKQPGNTDWRVRLSLGPGAQYLYNATPAGVLAPLAANGGTDGVIFPYTPSVTTTYSANYEQYDLIHSNYRGLFYKNSRVGDIQLRGTFTAQNTTEANYLLATIHFFRSVTKMFYGQDAERGTPPPICLLNGFGGYQFSDHPVVVSSFNYTLPNDVDYIRTTNPNNFGLDLNNRYNPSGASLPAGGALAGVYRLLNAIPGGLSKGALPRTPAPNTVVGSVTNNVPASYVPTKMEIDVTLIPVQSRSQVSQQFSLKGFANGDLLKGGFW